MMNSLTGQYECVHRSGVGLEYFTSRIDRLTMYANRRFVFVVQEQSRIAHAARSLVSGQQLDTNAPETRREGSYTSLGNAVSFAFDDGTQGQAQQTATGLQIGSDFYEKVSDSTMIPPTHRMKSNMEDIAKGIKIASAISGATIKAVKTLSDTIQSAQGTQATPSNPTSAQSSHQQGYQAPQTPPASSPPQPTYTPPTASPSLDDVTRFCDLCGAPARPGKSFCNRCGARLP